MLAKKQVECINHLRSVSVGKKTDDIESIEKDDIPEDVVKRFEFKMSVLEGLYKEFTEKCL